MCKLFQMSIAGAFEVVQFLSNADLHLVFRVREQAITVVDHMQRDVFNL